jgi:hypothetical protein
VKLYSPDKSELMDVSAIERDGDDLVIKGKVFGAMPMTARLRPAEAMKALGLIDLKTAIFILTLPFRQRSKAT